MKSTRVVFASLAAGLTMIIGTAGTAVAATSGVSAGGTVRAAHAVTTAKAAAADQAPEAKNDCADYSFCLWKNADYIDPFWSAPYFTSPHDSWTTVDESIDNLSSSLWNNRDSTTWIARYANGVGQQACLRPNQTYQNLGNWYWPDDKTPANDSISSYKLETTKTCPFDHVLMQKQ